MLFIIFTQNTGQLFIYTISQKKVTTQKNSFENGTCPATTLIKLLSGKWKPEIFRLAVDNSLRFNTLLRQIEGSNKQSLSVALKELEEVVLLTKSVIKLKPLHIEYSLTEKGKSLVPVLKQLEGLT